jgi:hypothetical protein
LERAELIICEVNNDDCAGVNSLDAGVVAEFQLPFDPDSKDADGADIEGITFRRGGVFEVIQEKTGRLLALTACFH